jgi:hypothetical protein
VDEVERPVRTRLVLVRHADAAGVDDAHARDGALELRVRVAADDDPRVDALEERRDPLLRRPLGEDVDVVPRRRVDVEHVADALRGRQPVQEGDLLLGELRAGRLEHLLRYERLLARGQLAVGVATEPADAVAEAAQPFERLGGLLAAGADVAADDDRRVARDLREHRVECGEVAVDVVERRDAHRRISLRRDTLP